MLIQLARSKNLVVSKLAPSGIAAHLIEGTTVHNFYSLDIVMGLSTRAAGRGHATPHMPVETAKCWWLLKIEPNAWAGGKGSCSICVDLQAVGALKFFGELYSLAKGFGPFFEGVWAGFHCSKRAHLQEFTVCTLSHVSIHF